MMNRSVTSLLADSPSVRMAAAVSTMNQMSRRERNARQAAEISKSPLNTESRWPLRRMTPQRIR